MRKRKGTILRIGSYMMKYRLQLFAALLLALFANAFALIGPMLSGYAVDAIQPGQGRVDFKGVFFYLGWMVLFYLVSALFDYLLQLLMIHISRNVVHRMRKDVFDKLMELPVGYFDVHQTGDIISRISYDIDTVNTSLSSDVIQLFTSVITVAGAFAMMLVISPRLVLVFAVTVPLSILLTKYITGKTRPLFSLRSHKLGELNGFVEEMVGGQKTLKAYRREAYTIGRFDGKNGEAVEAYYQAEYFGSMTGPAVNFINNLSLSFISVFGALLYLAGEMTIGNISSFVLYSRKFSGPINETANIIGEFQSTLAAAERVFRLLDQLPEQADGEGGKRLENPAGDVVMKNVEFAYEPGKTILHNLNLHARPGELIAVAGPTGAGKTTLINLLMRFYDVSDGAVYVDGEEIRRVTRDSLRGAYAMVLQDTWLFYGSIYENLAYGRADATIKEVVEAAKAAHIHSFIEHLPKGYDTILSDEGTNISKGQKQLLTIARAMLLDASMLILDEATSNVDTRTEIKIQKAMRKLMENKTCFVIAHRLSTIENADHILVVDHGEVVQQGRHEELMKVEGVYRRMYQAQFE